MQSCFSRCIMLLPVSFPSQDIGREATILVHVVPACTQSARDAVCKWHGGLSGLHVMKLKGFTHGFTARTVRSKIRKIIEFCVWSVRNRALTIACAAIRHIKYHVGSGNNSASRRAYLSLRTVRTGWWLRRCHDTTLPSTWVARKPSVRVGDGYALLDGAMLSNKPGLYSNIRCESKRFVSASSAAETLVLATQRSRNGIPRQNGDDSSPTPLKCETATSNPCALLVDTAKGPHNGWPVLVAAYFCDFGLNGTTFAPNSCRV